MRHSVDRILRPHEADDLAQEIGYLDFNDSRLQPILKAVSGFFPVSYEKPSYVRVEHKPEGHPWHTDQGNKGHMSWCKYSASVLLTRPVFDFSGGGFSAMTLIVQFLLFVISLCGTAMMRMCIAALVIRVIGEF